MSDNVPVAQTISAAVKVLNETQNNDANQDLIPS